MSPTLEKPAVGEKNSQKIGQKIGFVHLGCPKNLVDTETMLGLLEQDGHRIVADEADADVMLVNTCAFIEKAQEESVQCLVNLAEQGKRLIITGCLAQKFQGELLDLFPEADAVVGTANVPDIANILQKTQRGERVLAIQQDPTYLLDEDTARYNVTMGPSVYVKVAEGCDHRCTFCIIPTMRGNFRSRPIPNLVENVKRLAENGATEVVLVGQDTTEYGKDHGSTLAELLAALNAVEGVQWIRFLYAYPTEVSDDLLDTMNDCEKVVKYLDCPLQHSHPEILKRMGRPVTDVVAFTQRVREKIKNVALRTSFIVGFPGETEEHFAHLKDTLETVRFERLGVFEYSDVDTAASKNLDGKVTQKVIQVRRRTLMEVQQKIAYAQNQALLGQTLPVLIETVRDSGLLTGRTQWDAPEIDNTVTVTLPSGSAQVLPGEIVPVRITQATPYDLKGTALKCSG